MKHLEYAKNQLNDNIKKYCDINGNKLSLIIQHGVVSENGVNGMQANDMMGFLYHLFYSLNKDFPCFENSMTLDHLMRAIKFQEARTFDRINRGVEGKNEL